MVHTKSRSRFLAWVLFYVLLLTQAAPALAASSTHSISWVSGTDSVVSTVASVNDMMVTTPLRNYMTEHKLRVQFSITGDMEPGHAEIRLPRYIFSNRQGQPIGTFEIPLVQAPATGGETLFNWRVDTAKNEIVISNYARVPSGYFLTFDMKYFVNAYMVRDGYSHTFAANFTLTTGQQVETYVSAPLTIQYETTADLDSISKAPYAAYNTWQTSWGTAPSDAADYFYVVWQIYANAALDDTQPFTFDLRDINPSVGGQYGEFLGFSRTGSTNVTRDTLAGFHDKTNPAATIANPLGGTTGSANLSNWTYYVYYRYPRTLLVETTPGLFRTSVSNKAEGQVEGTDGAGNTLTAQATYNFAYNANPTPSPVPYTVPAPTAYAYKYNSGVSYGYIAKLEQHRSPFRLLSSITSGPYSMSNSTQAYQLTQVDGVYGAQDYVNEIVDDTIELSTTSYTAGTVLGQGDYQINSYRFGGYTEYDLTSPTTGGTTVRAAQDHARVYVEVKINGVYEQYGYFQRVMVGTSVQYAFTPIMAGATAVTAATPLLTFPAGVTGVRLRHTTRAYSTSFGYNNMGVEVLDSARVLSLIAGRDSMYVRNTVATRVLDASNILRSQSTYSAWHQLTRVQPRSYISKTRTEPVNDPANGRYYVDYTVQAYSQVTSPETTLAEAAAQQYMVEQRNSTFHELLPPGTQVNYSTLTVRGYGNNVYFPTNIVITDNWRGTGRTMLTVYANVPAGTSNYSFSGNYGGYSTTSSGMVLNFRLYNPWANVRDNGATITNYVGYESRDGSLGLGAYADTPPTSGAVPIPAALQPAMTDLSTMPATWTNTMYPNVPLTYQPLTAANAGFSKAVSSPEYPSFADHTIAHASGQYTYRLRYENPQTMYARDLVFYDVLETQYGSNPYWQGTLNSVDTAAALQKGMDAKVYVSLSEPANLAGDPNHLDNNPAFWTPVTATTDLSLVKAVAVDLRTKTDGTPYIMEPGEIVFVNLVMNAPVDSDGSIVANKTLAYNAPYMSNRKQPLGGEWDLNLALERANTVTVQLLGSRLGLTKTSVPATGTQQNPQPVYVGDTITYHISVSNGNTAQSLIDIQVEDLVPPGLSVDVDNIVVRVNNNDLTDLPIANHPRAHLISYAGGKLTFFISALAGGETITFMVPALVDNLPAGTSLRYYANTAQVTQLAGQSFTLTSDTTWHSAQAVAFLPTGTKTVLGRPMRADDVFTFRMYDYPQGQLVDEAVVHGPGLSSDPRAQNIPFSPLYFSRPGVYIYRIIEVPAVYDNMTIDGSEIMLRVTVGLNAQGELTADGVYDNDGVDAGMAQFTNPFTATSFTATKEWVLLPPGTTPPDITLRLFRDGEPYGEWGQVQWPKLTYEWTGLPLYKADGSLNPDGSRQESVYRASEVFAPPQYQLSYKPDGTIVNTYDPGTFSARKLWDGAPASGAQFQLYQTIAGATDNPPAYRRAVGTPVPLNGVPDPGITVDEDGEHFAWLYTWHGLDASGTYNGNIVNYAYEVSEVVYGAPPANDISLVPSGYEIDIGASSSTYITNVNQSRTITAVKEWVGGPEGEARPAVTLQLLQDGVAWGAPVTLNGSVDTPANADGSGERTPWQYTWTGLERFSTWTGSVDGMPDGQGGWLTEPSTPYNYTLEELPTVAGYTTTYGPDGWTVINTRLARAGNFVWYDLNRNGLQDAGEPGVPGVRVTIARTDGQAWPPGYDQVRITDSAGHYMFADLEPGEYAIRFDTSTLPEGFVPTLALAGADRAVDSNALSTTFQLTTEDDMSVDLGIVEAPTEPAIAKYINESMTHLDINNGYPYTYNVIVTLPNVIEEYTSFVITDTLDPRLELVSAEFARGKGDFFDVTMQGQRVQAAVKPGAFVPLGEFASVELIITTKIRPGVTDLNIPNTAALAYTDYAGTQGQLETAPVTVSSIQMMVVPVAFKVLTGRDMTESDVFRFELMDSLGRTWEAANMPPAGVATFPRLVFDAPGKYVYTMHELPGNADSVSYDPRVITLTVTVAPDTAGDGSLRATPVYTSADGQPLEQAVFDNFFHETSLTAHKRWVGGSGPRPPVTLRLLRDGVRYGEWVTLEWPQTTYTWTDLPLYKADGSRDLSVYRASEVVPPKYYQLSYDRDGTIVNTYRPGTFSARKVWRDVPGAGVQFQLYQTILGDTRGVPYRVPVGAPVPLDGVPDPGVRDGQNGEHLEWLYTWFNLPANGDADGEWVSFEYEVSETVAATAGAQEQSLVPEHYVVDTTASASTYISNVNLMVTKTASKVWVGVPAGEAQPPVRFQLLRDGEPLGAAVTLDGITDAPAADGSGELTPWHYTWTGLARFAGGFTGSEFGTYDEQGNPIIPASVPHVYTIRELAVPGYLSQPDPDGMTVVNTRLVQIGDFVWFDTNRNGLQDTGETGVQGVRVTITGMDGTTLPFGYNPVRVTDSKGLYLFENLPAGAYAITFDIASLPEGYVPTLALAGSDRALDANEATTRVTAATGDELTIDFGIARVPTPEPTVVHTTPPTAEITVRPPASTPVYTTPPTAEITARPPAPTHAPIRVPLTATKHMAGRDLGASEFTFVLRDAAGNVLQESTNAADGSIRFLDRTFSRTGKFLYTIREKSGGGDGITYDRTVYRVTIDVTVRGEALAASVSVTRDGVPYAGPVVFTNTYSTPATGDTALLLPLLLLCMSAVVGMGAVLIDRRKRKG